MFEHVGIAAFRDFFAQVRRPADRRRRHADAHDRPSGGPGVTDAFTAKYIFPGGYIPALSEIVARARRLRLFAPISRCCGCITRCTLREWYARSPGAQGRDRRAVRRAVLPHVDLLSRRVAAGFRYGGMVNYQIQFTRDRDALPMTRDYMVDEEARLRGQAGMTAARPSPAARSSRRPGRSCSARRRCRWSGSSIPR